MSQAGRLAVIERHTPAGARSDELTFDQMMHRAKVLANSGLVPKAFIGKPEAVVLVGTYGAELGMSLVTSLQFIDVIEGRPSVNAQGRLFLIRRAGHDAEFIHEECDDTKAVIRGRRRGSDTWQTVTWTAEEAEKAHLLDEWVERWCKTESGKSYLEKIVLKRDGDKYVPAAFGMTEMPAWAAKEIAGGRVKRKENWWSYRADQLVARAASRLCRRVFSDVMMGLGVEPLTAEEQGYSTATDLDETAAAVVEDQGDDEDDDIVDGEIVEEGERCSISADAAVGATSHGQSAPTTTGAAPAGATSSPLPAGPDSAPTSPSSGGSAPSSDQVATQEPEEAGENEGAAVVGTPAAPPPPGPLPRLATGGIDWREVAKRHGTAEGKLLLKARKFAEARGMEPPAEMKDVADEQLVADLVDWLGPA